MRAAITRKPAPSKRRYTSPIKLRLTPSGLTMERERSIGMMTSGAVAGNAPQRGLTKTAKRTGEGLSKQLGRLPKSLDYLEKPGPGCRATHATHASHPPRGVSHRPDGGFSL